MTRTPEAAEARITELETELARLKAGVRLSIVATRAQAPANRSVSVSKSGTVIGVEEMILQLNEDRTLAYLNAPMAKLVSIADRKGALGTPLADHLTEDLDTPEQALYDGLTTAIESALSTQKPCALETVFPGLSFDLLPDPHSKRPTSDPVLRVVVTPTKGRAQVVVQDVTYIRWLESTFSRYVSPNVIQQMHETDSEEFMDTESRAITILFADLRGFTAMCESLKPEAVRDTVNSFLEGMVASIEKYGGTVDKFVGDEVMALFGAPLHDDSHALHALLCALDMQAVHCQWQRQRTTDELPAPALGIGLATGNVVIGNIGTATRMDYTALGSNVNLAARLCGSAEGGETLTVRATYEQSMTSARAYKGTEPLPHIRFKKKGAMEFKNIADKVDVVTVHSGE